MARASRKLEAVNSPLQGFSDATDDEFRAQVEALMELPLEQRLEGLAAAEAALRQRLGQTGGNQESDSTS